MPRPPTGNPRGRPKGTGRLTPNQTVDEAQTRVTVRLPTRLYDRLETFAAGRSYHRGSPQLARCVREALEEYLERHTNRQTENITTHKANINRQTENNILVADVVTRGVEEDNRQTRNVPMSLEQAEDISSQSVIEQEKSDALPAAALGAPVQDNRQITNGVPAYDATKYTLGKLCPRAHAHGTTGQSLLRRSNRHCLACDREKASERQKAKHQAASVA